MTTEEISMMVFGWTVIAGVVFALWWLLFRMDTGEKK